MCMWTSLNNTPCLNCKINHEGPDPTCHSITSHPSLMSNWHCYNTEDNKQWWNSHHKLTRCCLSGAILGTFYSLHPTLTAALQSSPLLWRLSLSGSLWWKRPRAWLTRARKACKWQSWWEGAMHMGHKNFLLFLPTPLFLVLFLLLLLPVFTPFSKKEGENDGLTPYSLSKHVESHPKHSKTHVFILKKSLKCCPVY